MNHRPPDMDGREYYAHQRYGKPTPRGFVILGRVLLVLFAGILAGLAVAYLAMIGSNLTTILQQATH